MSKRLLSIGLAMLLLFAVALSATGCGSTNNPEGVVNAFFESIDKQDTKKFLNCFEKDVRKDLLDDIDEEDLKDLLETMDEYLEDEFGKKWVKEIKVTDVDKGDTDDGVTEYTVTIEMEGDEEDFEVIKVKGKYYIDQSAMNDLVGF